MELYCLDEGILRLDRQTWNDILALTDRQFQNTQGRTQGRTIDNIGIVHHLATWTTWKGEPGGNTKLLSMGVDLGGITPSPKQVK